MEKRAVNPWTWQDQMGFVQANEVTGASRTLVVSGQTSVDENGGVVHAGDMRAQIARAIANLETVLKAGGFELTDVVKLTYFTTDMDAFLQNAGPGLARLAEVGNRPAATLLGISRLFQPDILVEIEAIAMK